MTDLDTRIAALQLTDDQGIGISEVERRFYRSVIEIEDLWFQVTDCPINWLLTARVYPLTLTVE